MPDASPSPSANVAKITDASVDPRATKGIFKIELSTLERAWIVQSLGNQKKMLLRSLQKEISGGEVATIRNKEIKLLDALLERFQG